MVEYKELERALIARMFRQGVIDATAFMNRCQVLGYDPNDVFLMLQLETTEAAKVLLIGSGVFSVDVSNNVVGQVVSKTDYSAAVSCGGFTYVLANFEGSHSIEGAFSGELQFLDVNDGVIWRKSAGGANDPGFGTSFSAVFAIASAPPTNAVKVRVGGSCSLRSGQIGSAHLGLKSLEGIKI